ncbi:MAG: YigZ family protein [Flavobacteriales bacterium]|nr:YigZ family protein [Flavobacteriales bacterium]
MTIDRYRSISNACEATLRERASRFIGIAFPIRDEEEFRIALGRISRSHHGANHFCYAFVLGPDATVHRVNDAGEPSGTAGRPILRAIRSMELTNTAVVVVRYFGGTLLGKAGLVKAYGEAARSALAEAIIVEHVVRENVHFACDHAQFDRLKKELAQIDGVLGECTFNERCEGVVALPVGSLHTISDRWIASGIDVLRTDQAK